MIFPFYNFVFLITLTVTKSKNSNTKDGHVCMSVRICSEADIIGGQKLILSESTDEALN